LKNQIFIYSIISYDKPATDHECVYCVAETGSG
jgi:hypothetical protein